MWALTIYQFNFSADSLLYCKGFQIQQQTALERLAVNVIKCHSFIESTLMKMGQDILANR